MENGSKVSNDNANLLTPSEVAARLKVSPRTVVVWLQDGKLAGMKVGKSWRVRLEDLEAFLGRGPRWPEPPAPQEPQSRATDLQEQWTQLRRHYAPLIGPKRVICQGYPIVPFTDDDPLDDLSNSVLDLIAEGNLDRAEEVCQQLLAEYPDQIDGLERTAKVAEARGDLPRAIEYHRLAADFAATTEGFDPEVERDFRARGDALEARLRGEKGQTTES